MTDKRIQFTSNYLGAKCEFRKTEGYDPWDDVFVHGISCCRSASRCYLDPYKKLIYRCEDHIIDCVRLSFVELSEDEIICAEILGS
jgi:hypothetical protein